MPTVQLEPSPIALLREPNPIEKRKASAVTPDVLNYDRYTEFGGLIWNLLKSHLNWNDVASWNLILEEQKNPNSLSAGPVGFRPEELYIYIYTLYKGMPRRETTRHTSLIIHGTQVRLVTAYFTGGCLSMSTGVEQYLNVGRSRFYELKNPEDRVGATKVVLTLFKYAMSGSAAMIVLG